MQLPTYLPPQKYNPILDADSYKIPHWKFYRPGIQRVYSFLESRGGDEAEIMMAGLQPLLYEKLAQPLEAWQIEEAQEFASKHFGTDKYFNSKMWDEIVNKNDSRLPLLIRSLPEGLIVPKRTPMVTVENTGSAFTAPLTSYKETMLMRDVWPACSIASRVFRMKREIKAYFDATSDNGISPFAILDFSSRGVFGESHSKIAGAAFTFMFQGSDNIPGIRHANYYYFHDMAAYSVAATEHSIASGWVRDDDGYIDNCLEAAEPGQILSLVGDTWNIYAFAKAIAREDRRQKISNKGLKIVIRPDSGKRAKVLPKILGILGDAFGTMENSKGFDVINMNVKVLWADGMNEKTVIEPFWVAEQLGISADSVMTGAGGGIAAADLDRDTDRWAFKASEYLLEDGTRMGVFKDPITDPGKASKQGRFSVLRCTHGHFQTENRESDVEDAHDLLQPRFLNGEVINATTLDRIRELVDSQL